MPGLFVSLPGDAAPDWAGLGWAKGRPQEVRLPSDASPIDCRKGLSSSCSTAPLQLQLPLQPGEEIAPG